MSDRLIELLENSPRLDAMYGEYDVAADWLLANGVTVQEWISVKDRLPEQFVDVLALRDGKISIDYYEEDGFFAYDFKGKRATHWMPLPQPPKGE